MITKTEAKALLTQAAALSNEITAANNLAAKKTVERERIYDQLAAEGVPSGKYGNFLLEVKKQPKPRCTDWPALHEYIRENNAFELLHKRLTETALVERKNAGDYTPGIVFDEKTSFRIFSAV